MRLGLFIAGIAFLCNPMVSTVDLLPDCIGWLLIYFSFLRPSFVNEKLSVARRAAGIAALVTLPRILFSLSYLSGDMAHPFFGDRILALTLAFLYAVGEAFLFCSFLKNYFEGITDVSTLSHDKKSVALLEKRRRRGVRFILCRGVLSLLPELVYLGNFSYLESDINGVYMDIRKAHPTLSGISCALFVPIGIAFFVSMCRFVRALRRDGSLPQTLHALYTEKSEALFCSQTRYRIGLGFVFFFAAFVPFLPWNLDGVRFLPQLLTPLLLLAALKLIAPFAWKPSKKEKALFAISMALCTVWWVISLWYYTSVWDEWGTRIDSLVQMTPQRIFQRNIQFCLFALSGCASVLLFLLCFAAIRRLRRFAETPLYRNESLESVLDAACPFATDKQRLRRHRRPIPVLLALSLASVCLSEFPLFSFYATPLPLAQGILGAALLLFLYLHLSDLYGAAKRLLR